MVLRMTRSWMAAAVLVVTVGAFGCSGSGNPASPDGPFAGGLSGPDGGGPTASGFGRLTLGITDTPFEDATAVLITFDNISAHRSGGDWEDIEFADGETERTCDLKKLEGPTDLLGSEMLPAGHYTQIRLNVKRATIHFDNASTSATACAPSITVPGTQFTELSVPSGEVKLNREFTLEPGAVVEMLLDFDGDKSIRQQGGGGGRGNGNGNGNASEDDEIVAPEDGSYSLHPVVSIISVTAQ